MGVDGSKIIVHYELCIVNYELFVYFCLKMRKYDEHHGYWY